jgi:hypothetical protein
MSKPPIDWKHYIEHQGLTCPYCGSVDLEGGSFNADGGYARCSVTCCGCGRCWDDVYRLVDVDNKPEEDPDGQEESSYQDPDPDDPGPRGQVG